MSAVSVGDGLAGTIPAKSLQDLDKDVETVVCGEESSPYYPHPNLIEFLAGWLPYERLFAFPKERIVSTFVGEANPEDVGHDVLTRENAADGLHRRLILQDGRLLGANRLGTKKHVCEICRFMFFQKNVDRWRDDLFNDDFSFAEVLS